jgi:beta-lactam-binding protein with PASTA domain
MDDNNRFLNNYKKKTAEQSVEPVKEAPAAETAGPPSRRYEEKSGFRPLRTPGGGAPTGRKKLNVLVPIIIAAVVVIGAVIGLIVYLNRGVEVMDFKGWTISDVQLWASDNKVKLQTEEQYNDQVDENKIISQEPADGATVAKGGFVKVVISKGHDLTVSLPLPDIMNMTKEEIDAWSAQNFMTKVRITTEFSDDVEEGRVISFEINDNTVVDNVKRNTPIYIIVSKGKEDDTSVLITIPNFREKTISDSYIFANENGLLLKVEEQYDDYAPKGTIISQSVKADDKVKKGTEISLVVSKGKKITVADFSPYTKQKAQALATELGIPVSILEKYSTAATGKFISQSIPAGTVYEDGDVLELYYSLGNKVVIGNYVGQMRDAMETWAKELNDQGCAITIKATYTQSNAAKGAIIYQDKANTSIGVKTTINITVSSGKAVFVPDFVAPAGSGYDAAITREKALAMCEALNIVPVFVKASKSGRLPGEIWSQSVAAGKEVSEGTKITLKYNPSSTTISVPNFVGMTEAQIRAGNYFKQLAITFVYAETYVDGYPEKVYQQSVRANTTVVAGTAVTLTISPAAPPPPP